MKVLVIGLNPSRKMGKSLTLKKLKIWLDELGLNYVSFCNLYEYPEIKNQTPNIKFIKSIYRDYDKVIALGSVVSDQLLRNGIAHGYLPHPSGLNRLTNDKEFVHQNLDTCKNYLRGNNDIRKLSDRSKI